MGYMHIENLYKNQEILLFKHCYALEKIHGTSAHVFFETPDAPEPARGRDVVARYHHGGAKAEAFNALFDKEKLVAKYSETFPLGTKVWFYGEAYGGSMQKMGGTYGPELRFVVFDVKIDDNWLSVPQAAALAETFGLEFVHYWYTATDLDAVNGLRDSDSVQAMRNGMGEGHKMEGIVLRPTVEMTKNNGNRIIAKHKRDDFSETATPRKVVDPSKLQVLQDAQAIADEWVTMERLRHVLDKLPGDVNIENMRGVISAMQEDVFREAVGEVVDSKEARAAVSRKTAQTFKAYLQSQLRE